MKKTLIASSVTAALLALPTLSMAQTPNNGFSFVDDAKATLGLRNL